MIGRVSQQSMASKFTQNALTRENALQKSENQLASGYRVNLPSDDPVATINYMDYDSRLKEINTYSNLIQDNENKLNLTDGALNNTTQVMQRLRELAVQMANGTYSKEERMNAATEVDQLMRQVLANANTQFKGVSLFGGTSITNKAFVPQFTVDPKSGQEFIEKVDYLGNHQSQLVEIDRGETVAVNAPGNQIFWSGNMTIIPTKNVNGYTAPVDGTIVVDGKEINIRRGDNLETIAHKINNSGVAVNASIMTENGQSIFQIESTSPHQVTLRDIKGGHVLEELGLIDSQMYPPLNYSPSAKVYQNSIFDALINFRKALMKDDTFKIGGTALGRIDQSLANILKFRARLGAVSERMHNMRERFLDDKVYYSDAKQKSIGTDITQATMDMKMLEFSQNVALSVGARLMPKTLLDFLR